jgi:hypothetical protein
LKEEKAENIAVFYREVLIFFAVLFFTCVVGLIELLPQLETTNGLLSWSWLLMSCLYFGLVVGVDYSLDKCFRLYQVNRWFRERLRVGFYYPDIEFLVQKIFKKFEYLEEFLIVVITLFFVLLYLVKIGILP